MFFLITLIASALYMEFSAAASIHQNSFYKTSGPFFVSKEAVNWTDAKIGCKNVGLELASVISEEERTALNIFIIEHDLRPKDKWSGYWLSGIRHDDGKFYWDTTETEVDSSFHGWVWGEPSHAYGRENCMELKWDEISLGWNDYFCDETRRYICQAPRKFKPKIIKNKLLKQIPLYQKEWQYNESNEYDTTQSLGIKETDNYGKPEDAIDYYPDYDYTTQTGIDKVKLEHTKNMTI